MRLPTWKELEEEQLEVLEYPLDRSLFVVGPPGSGKTVLAVRRAQAAAKAGDTSLVRIVTFNRMLRRLLKLMNDGGRLHVFTMHTFIWRHYERLTGSPPPRLKEHEYDWNSMLEALRRPMRASFHMKHLVVDEGQDLPEGFFRYALRHVSSVMTVFADEYQALDAQRATIEQIKNAANLPDPAILKLNHRNTPEIARLAEHFHGGRLPAATVLRSSSAEVPCLVRSQSLEATVIRVSNWFRNRGGSIGVIVAQKQLGRDLHAMLSRKLSSSRVDVYDSDLKNENSIDVLASGVTILNKRSVKGQEFDTVFIVELDRFIPFADESARRAMYMMCTRARDNLFLVHGPADLSSAALAALPGPNVLERP